MRLGGLQTTITMTGSAKVALNSNPSRNAALQNWLGKLALRLIFETFLFSISLAKFKLILHLNSKFNYFYVSGAHLMNS